MRQHVAVQDTVPWIRAGQESDAKKLSASQKERPTGLSRRGPWGCPARTQRRQDCTGGKDQCRRICDGGQGWVSTPSHSHSHTGSRYLVLGSESEEACSGMPKTFSTPGNEISIPTVGPAHQQRRRRRRENARRRKIRRLQSTDGRERDGVGASEKVSVACCQDEKTQDPLT